MPIRLALYAKSRDILKQARQDFSKLSAEFKLDLQMALFTEFPDFINNIKDFDIAGIYDKEFYAVLPEVTALLADTAFPRVDKSKALVVSMFSVPVDDKSFMEVLKRLPGYDSNIEIPIPKGCKSENISNIIYFENKDRKIYIKTAFDCYVTQLSMKAARDLTASYAFASPYVSFLVNLEWVERVAGRDVLLKNNETLPLSQKKAAMFREVYRR